MTEDELVRAAVDATERRFAAEADVRAAILDRDRAVWDLRFEHGWTLMKIANAQRDQLLALGHTDDEIRGAGAGYDSVRRATRGPRP